MHSLRAFNDRRVEKRALKAANAVEPKKALKVYENSPTHYNVGRTKQVMSDIATGSEAGSQMSRKERYAQAVKSTDKKYGHANTDAEWIDTAKANNGKAN